MQTRTGEATAVACRANPPSQCVSAIEHVHADRMRIMLRTNFGVKEQDLRHLNKRKLAACLAEQLLYETDDEDDDDGEEEEEEDEEEDDIHN